MDALNMFDSSLKTLEGFFLCNLYAKNRASWIKQ